MILEHGYLDAESTQTEAFEHQEQSEPVAVFLDNEQVVKEVKDAHESTDMVPECTYTASSSSICRLTSRAPAVEGPNTNPVNVKVNANPPSMGAPAVVTRNELVVVEPHAAVSPETLLEPV